MVKGQYATMGFVSNLSKPVASYNSVLVDMLLENGAVLYCKTTLPQGLIVSRPSRFLNIHCGYRDQWI